MGCPFSSPSAQMILHFLWAKLSEIVLDLRSTSDYWAISLVALTFLRFVQTFARFTKIELRRIARTENHRVVSKLNFRYAKTYQSRITHSRLSLLVSNATSQFHTEQ